MNEEEYGDGTCSTCSPVYRTANFGGTRDRTADAERTRPRLHLSRVRDYRDRFILRTMQAKARSENPGFLYLIEEKEKAKIAWVEVDGERSPGGYYIYSEPRREFSRHAHGPVQFPMTLTQIFVREEFRRQGVATRMVQDFIHHSSLDAIWVESPKAETKALLNKLGYFEPSIPYELWQMMEGLSRWMRIQEFVIRAKLVPPSSEELRVWSGDSSVVLEDLR